MAVAKKLFRGRRATYHQESRGSVIAVPYKVTELPAGDPIDSWQDALPPYGTALEGDPSKILRAKSLLERVNPTTVKCLAIYTAPGDFSGGFRRLTRTGGRYLSLKVPLFIRIESGVVDEWLAPEHFIERYAYFRVETVFLQGANFEDVQSLLKSNMGKLYFIPTTSTLLTDLYRLSPDSAATYDGVSRIRVEYAFVSEQEVQGIQAGDPNFENSIVIPPLLPLQKWIPKSPGWAGPGSDPVVDTDDPVALYGMGTPLLGL